MDGRDWFAREFAQEFELGASNRPYSVCIELRVSKNGSAYGRVRATGALVNWMPVKGYNKRGLVHLWWNGWGNAYGDEQRYLGEFPRAKLQALIKRFGSQHKRDLLAALVDVGIISRKHALVAQEV